MGLHNKLLKPTGKLRMQPGTLGAPKLDAVLVDCASCPICTSHGAPLLHTNGAHHSQSSTQVV
jgi:hypothetical protein